MIEGATRVIEEQQEIINMQSRLIADLISTLENWELVAEFDGKELKERAINLQEREEKWK
jgi:hypothetical protein